MATAVVQSEEEKKRLDAKYRPSFDMLDKNGDGYITVSEIAITYESMGLSPPETLIRQMQRLASIKGRSGIDFEQFAATMERVASRHDVEEELRSAFSLVDKDNDGLVSREEILQVADGLGETLSDREFGRLMRDADTNGDGFLNQEEFTVLMKKYGWGKS